MTDKPEKPSTHGRKKVRDDDARGTPKGAAVVPARNGGRIGNPAFVPTEDQRKQVEALAKTFPPHANHLIAVLLKISRSTLERHFADELLFGRAQLLASVGGQLIAAALDTNAPAAKGDRDLQKYIMARLGGWTTKVEMSPKGDRATEHVDLSNLSPEQLEDYGKLALAAEGFEPEDDGDDAAAG